MADKCPKCGTQIDVSLDDPAGLWCENKVWWHTVCFVQDLRRQLAALTEERDQHKAARELAVMERDHHMADKARLAEENAQLQCILGEAEEAARVEEVRATKAEADNARLREALQDLMDVQNGPPLVRDEEDWNKAMSSARAALSGEGKP